MFRRGMNYALLLGLAGLIPVLAGCSTVYLDEPTKPGMMPTQGIAEAEEAYRPESLGAADGGDAAAAVHVVSPYPGTAYRPHAVMVPPKMSDEAKAKKAAKKKDDKGKVVRIR